MCTAPDFRFFTDNFYGSKEDHEVLPLQMIPQTFMRITFFILLNLSAVSQHDGEPLCFFMTLQRDLDKAGYGHRKDHTNRS